MGNDLICIPFPRGFVCKEAERQSDRAPVCVTALTSMASAPLSVFPTPTPSLSSSKTFHHLSTSFTCSTSTLSVLCPSSGPRRKGHRYGRILAMGGDLLGDFGARDPFPAEIASNFGENVVGNVDTEHRILIPNLSALSLAQRSCEPISPTQPPMSSEDARKLLKKVVGWRLFEGDGGMKLQCMWKLRDYGCGIELINRIYKITEAAGHCPDLHLEQPNQVRAELWTASIGGLSMNDFIVAAKIDGIKTSDLLPKKRIWA